MSRRTSAKKKHARIQEEEQPAVEACLQAELAELTKPIDETESPCRSRASQSPGFFAECLRVEMPHQDGSRGKFV